MSSDMERDLRDMMHRTAEGLQHSPAPTPGLLRRARLRRAGTAMVAGVAAVALVVSGVAASRSLSDDHAIPPANPDSQGTFTDVHGWIAYRSGSEIRAVDPADPGQTISLGSFHECLFPRALFRCGDGDPIGWSPDGTRLLVSIQIEGSGRSFYALGGLYVLGDDGTRTRLSKETHLRPHLRPQGWGAFSPDGSQVVYSQGTLRGPYLVDVDGGTLRSLVADPCTRPIMEAGGKGRWWAELCGQPAAEATAWSPDGSTIAWLDFGEGTIPGYGAGHENFLSFVNPDGTGLREGVATLPGTFGGESLVWSPDGSRLAFWMADDDDRNAQIFVINADGTGLRQVTEEGENLWPTWSPDGSRIAFVRDGALHTMAPDGSDVRQVEGVRPDGPIAWNPLAP